MALAAVLLSVIAAPAAAAPPPANTFSCTASALRVTLLGIKIEPVVANMNDAPCVSDSKGVVGPVAFGPVSVAGVLTARTTASPSGGSAESTVTRAGIALAGGITADVLTSKTNVSCKNGQPSFSSSGEVVNVRIGNVVIAVPANQAPVVVNIPLVGTLFLNQVVTTPNSITRRALFLDTLVTDVVIAESKANVEGKPCGATPPPPKPQCSDGVDNADPEDGLADANDPGCLSGPGGAYNPNDDDETNQPPPKPQCSDGSDNDGDKAIDGSDPQCHTDGNPKNDASYDPNDNDESK